MSDLSFMTRHICFEFGCLMKQLNLYKYLKAAVYSNAFLVMSVCNQALVITRLTSQAAQ